MYYYYYAIHLDVLIFLTTSRNFIRNELVCGIARSLTRCDSIHRSVVSNEQVVSEPSYIRSVTPHE
jgi:hypothetical protein